MKSEFVELSEENLLNVDGGFIMFGLCGGGLISYRFEVFAGLFGWCGYRDITESGRPGIGRPGIGRPDVPGIPGIVRP